MRKIEIELYDYDELSEEAQERALDEYLSSGFEYPCLREVRDTIKALCDRLGVRLDDWEFDQWSADPGYIKWTDDWWTDERRSLAGNRARAFLWNNYGDLLLSPATHYYVRRPDGKMENCVSVHSVKYKSKVFFDRVYDGTCPMTGMSFDCDALDPMANFVFGVEWNERERRRTPVPFDRRDAWKYTTVEDIVKECFTSLLEAASKDYRWHTSKEGFLELCRANEWTFEKSGKMRNC